MYFNYRYLHFLTLGSESFYRDLSCGSGGGGGGEQAWLLWCLAQYIPYAYKGEKNEYHDYSAILTEWVR